ncbi:E3 ubiquitin/ISG15 ligase TRIM25 [Triplophysa tibetana]|uniref:E3 ubiquitin/ISG15 ligase TRIM25 n=1 Tax=Triplophysa tibetana TaxID=1572043 RepID=A0A5A9N8I5_9TELE|nr:E3 ubiquitin/ISG15 ligase TRIM25 [Triplophysa tibetana]
MAEGFSEDEFMCSVCLDLLKDPVTVPCGHTYCMRCITDCWNHEDQTGIYSCPQCRQTFSPRPVLGKNVMVAEMVDRLKKTKLSDHCDAGAGDVECDVCTGRKHKAIKSCLMCLNSYCQTHLEQHENLFRGRRHNLIDPTRRLQEMICPQHQKMMEIYCIQCQRCICMMCLDEHRNHDTASISAANTEKRSQLGETQNKLQQKILKEERDLQKLRDTVDYHKHSAQSAVEDCEMTFTEIMYEVTQLIRDQEKTEVSRAEGLLERQKQKIEDLKSRYVELKNILQTRDNIQFLQSLQCLSVSGSTENITSVTSDVSFDDDVMKSVSQFRDKLQRFCREAFHKITVTRIQVPEPKSRSEFLRYLHTFTLDPNTVNGFLRFAERNRTLTIAFPPLLYPTHPDRFDYWYQSSHHIHSTSLSYVWTGTRLGTQIVIIMYSKRQILQIAFFSR